MKKRRTAAEIIAFHFSLDHSEMADRRYQPTRYTIAIYTIGDDYFCAPSGSSKPPAGFDWKLIGSEYDRPIYKAKGT